ncbi:MAG: TM0106 family RecB-like putative nuclease [Candidatus Eisenbacteria bacterium]|uniref:TM0106 family RecB-like putative nuclease n=1 Tax=Eiseniibacteriota bacterium TaxID=2212470 RepID=A0A948RTM1_UNCEI|nr:TM0106 family RecB-like putative nuclease [Candidatus Eisenbacteria bacterium]MBU1948823.1 TM0106 family RecB-like putative nuclease [Candidatus Eisenbacteria bacterium]MBU2690660.1 TM0106 family RecB-like putative nuclease [Candidatus Eisenbacteria bacterium]
MKKSGASIQFSPTDLTNYLQNPYITWMDRLYLEHPDRTQPDASADEAILIRKRGLEHERDFLAQLKAAQKDICEISTGADRVGETAAAMAEGRGIIYQAALSHEKLTGYADFLIKTGKPSKLGNYSYEVWDTKLSLQTKPYFLIQLCCLAEILEAVQGTKPELIRIVLGDGTQKSFRTDDFFFYYLFLKRGFLAQQNNFDPQDPQNPPEPLGEGKNGRWESTAGQWLQEHDHLSLVAGITTIQIERLKNVKVTTVAQLAKAHRKKVPKMRAETQEKLCEQARLQMLTKTTNKPHFEQIKPDPQNPARGLALLPPASKNDVTFDIEGYPLAQFQGQAQAQAKGGLEYLLGAVTIETPKRASRSPKPITNPELTYHDWWAHDERHEKKSFEAFIDWAYARWNKDPAMHIYHYAAYEVTAIKRLMTKYATRENEVDTLLRAGVFVDLYKIVQQGVRMGLPSYSLKKVEQFYLDGREAEVATAGDSILFYERWLEAQDGATWETSKILNEIRNYNKEDCESTHKLTEWLRGLQKKWRIDYIPDAGAAAPAEAMREPTAREILSQELLDSIPDGASTEASSGASTAPASKRDDQWRIRELLAWLVTFHRREQKPMWWEYYNRHEMTDEELWDDLGCLAGLKRTRMPAVAIKQSTGFEYRFDPDQDTKLTVGSICEIAGHRGWKVKIGQIDMDAGRVLLLAGPKALEAFEEIGSSPPAQLSLVPDDHVGTESIEASIERVVREYQKSNKLPSALDDYLHRRRPRIHKRMKGPLLRKGEDILAGTLDAALNMRDTTLCIQGPPGSGKTHTAAHVILGLLQAGKRVGISANSHKAICNLMGKVAEFAKKAGVGLSAAKVGGEPDDPLFEETGIRHEASTKQAIGRYDLIGGTAWAFVRPEAVGSLDYLFIDEAGQVCIANLAGMIPSARNVVLLGDQMQLGQPTRGSHPGESGLSTLEYLLQDHATIPDDLGIFLGTTWRLHPELCRFISEAVYEGRLQPEKHTAARRILVAGSGAIKGRIKETPAPSMAMTREAGLLFIPVEHAGNVQGSDEEVDAIDGLIQSLLKLEHTDKKGKNAGRLTLDDILIVAPYNMQIRKLKQALGPGARIGTIDKFQGQEAPVVIVSMCASAGDTSPRGIDFLFNKNRLNVAISRAQSLAIVVGHPNLTETLCGSIREMELVNLYCRVVEEGLNSSGD